MFEHEKQIKNLVQVIKNYYKERKAENINELLDCIYSPDENPIIIGTSNGEWMIGIDATKELFLSDWEGWGNVDIDLQSLACGHSDGYAWFHVNANVEYCFTDNNDIYDAFMSDASEIATSEKPIISKAGEILWLLSHLLHTRPNGERKYKWAMNITGILQKINDNYKIKLMQFSIPVLSAYPDVRIDINKDDQNIFLQECNKIYKYNNNQNNKNSLIRQQISTLFNNNENIKFVCDGKKRYMGTDGILRDGNEFADYFTSCKQINTISLLPDNMIVENAGDSAMFCGVGIMKSEPSLENDLANILNNIGSYNQINDKKEALFNLRRDLAQIIKESSLSKECNAPFRIEGVAKSDNSHTIVEYLQISYPFNCVLEQKTDAAKKVSVTFN